MITIGLLIALGLEQAVEAWRHRELRAQAREKISTESATICASWTPNGKVVGNRKDTQHALDIVEQVWAPGELSELSIHLGTNGASLNSASWTTASTTGRLGLHGLGDTKRFPKAHLLAKDVAGLRGSKVPLNGDRLGTIAAHHAEARTGFAGFAAQFTARSCNFRCPGRRLRSDDRNSLAASYNATRDS